jgi:hypothetical protein
MVDGLQCILRFVAAEIRAPHLTRILFGIFGMRPLYR